jgi:hypothetical protein
VSQQERRDRLPAARGACICEQSSSTGARPRRQASLFLTSFQARLTDSQPASLPAHRPKEGQLHAWTLLHEEVQRHKACQAPGVLSLRLSQISRGNFLIAGSQASQASQQARVPAKFIVVRVFRTAPTSAPQPRTGAQARQGARPASTHLPPVLPLYSTTATSSLKPLARPLPPPPSPPLPPPIHGFFPAFSRSHAHSSILRYPCATDRAPVELHCDHEPGPGLHRASTVPVRCFHTAAGIWTDVLGYPRSPVTRTRLLLYPPSFEDRPVLIHNSPFSSSGSTLLV